MRYELACRRCEHEFEAQVPVAERERTECPACGERETAVIITRNRFAVHGGPTTGTNRLH